LSPPANTIPVGSPSADHDVEGSVRQLG
jgi:hypothetical protein